MEPLYKNPDRLRTLGLERSETDSSEVRVVIYRKYLFTIGALNSYLEIEFSLVIDDDPKICYLNSREYTFEGSYIRTTDNDLAKDNFNFPMVDVRTNLNIDTLKGFRELLKVADQLSRFLS